MKKIRFTKMVGIVAVFALCFAFVPQVKASASEIELGATYVINNAFTISGGYYISYSSLKDGANVNIVENGANKFRQYWKILPANSASVYLICPATNTNLALDCSGGDLQLKPVNTLSNTQRWTIGTSGVMKAQSNSNMCIEMDYLKPNYNLIYAAYNPNKEPFWYHNKTTYCTHNFVKGVCSKCQAKLGDVNEDGVVNDTDNITLTRYVANWNGQYVSNSLSDMNRDGILNDADVVLLGRLLAGWDIWG